MRWTVARFGIGILATAALPPTTAVADCNGGGYYHGQDLQPCDYGPAPRQPVYIAPPPEKKDPAAEAAVARHSLATRLNQEGLTLFAAGNYQAADERFREALEIEPQSRAVLWNHARALQLQGRLIESLKAFTALTKLTPATDAYFETYSQGALEVMGQMNAELTRDNTRVAEQIKASREQTKASREQTKASREQAEALRERIAAHRAERAAKLTAGGVAAADLNKAYDHRYDPSLSRAPYDMPAPGAQSLPPVRIGKGRRTEVPAAVRKNREITATLLDRKELDQRRSQIQYELDQMKAQPSPDQVAIAKKKDELVQNQQQSDFLEYKLRALAQSGAGAGASQAPKRVNRAVDLTVSTDKP